MGVCSIITRIITRVIILITGPECWGHLVFYDFAPKGGRESCLGGHFLISTDVCLAAYTKRSQQTDYVDS
jgi:hypothetical protein